MFLPLEDADLTDCRQCKCKDITISQIDSMGGEGIGERSSADFKEGDVSP